MKKKNKLAINFFVNGTTMEKFKGVNEFMEFFSEADLAYIVLVGRDNKEVKLEIMDCEHEEVSDINED